MANSYLSRTPGSTTDAQRKQFTISVWVKRSTLLTGSNHQEVLSAFATDQFGFRFQGDNKLDIFDYSVSGNNYPLRLVTNRLFRDTSAWYNIVLQVDTPNSTSSERVKLWVNGVQETSFGTATYPSQDYTASWNKNGLHQIGSKAWGNSGNGSDMFPGYLAHVANVAGSVVAPTVFGQTDSTSGIWKFKPPSGVTWGTNGFHLKFENSGNLGLDSSGNSNTFTVNGNLKQSLSTPSNNYNTWNFNNKYNNMTISNAGTAIAWQQTSGNAWCASNLGVGSGKWYWEWKAESEHPEANTWGVMSVDSTAFTDPKTDSGVWCMNQGVKHNGSNGGSYGSQIDIGNIGMVAVDMDNGKIWLGENGTWFASGDPAAGSNAMYTNLSGKTVTPFHADTYSTYTPFSSYNFGEGRFATTAISSAGSNGNGSLFEYDVPSGFYALNTKNLNTYG